MLREPDGFPFLPAFNVLLFWLLFLLINGTCNGFWFQLDLHDSNNAEVPNRNSSSAHVCLLLWFSLYEF